MNPFFSIVIPTYNRGHLLEKTVQTVLGQSFTDFELLVVDDGSSDNTGEVIKEIMAASTARISYLKQINSERAAARNNGLKNASGAYVLFFDSDDTLYPNHLQVAYDYIVQNNRPEFMHLRYDVKNDAGKITKEGPVFDTPPNKQLIKGNFLSCNGVFIRKDIALANPFNENRKLSAMEDWELWLRLGAMYPIHYVNTITSSIINHDERSVVITKKEALVDRAELLVYLVTHNPAVMAYYKTGIRRFRSSCYSYVALHLSLTGHYKRYTLRYLVKSVVQWPASVFHRRFFATIKRLF